MITGRINDKIPSWYPKALKDLLSFFQKSDFQDMEEGRYEIQGDDVFFMVMNYETKNPKEARPEDHEVYVDVQMVVEGEEYFGVTIGSEELKEVEAYDAERDIRFYAASDKYGQLHLKQGMYIVVMPEDIHAPCLHMPDGARKVKKIVGKIKHSLLEA